jgi:hypothetical protein
MAASFLSGSVNLVILHDLVGIDPPLSGLHFGAEYSSKWPEIDNKRQQLAHFNSVTFFRQRL